MHDVPTRDAAMAGRWYPRSTSDLTNEIDRYLRAARTTRLTTVTAIIAPHAGLMYSGPVAAYAYQELEDRDFDLAVLVGPAHAGGFDGVALWPRGQFASPLGGALIDAEAADRIAEYAPAVRTLEGAHLREHSLEMQLPFLKRVAPDATILPLLMGWQTRDTADALTAALVAAVSGRRAVLIASTDLSHYEDAGRAAELDAVVIHHVERFDSEGLQEALSRNPHHACGGGPAVAVMRAAWALGARDSIVHRYADSGDVSGDKSSVVGYLAAALGLK